ncbi:helix-hairpin-helix domain-containing protein [Amycolatopsis sp. MEPSY49]|uniref:helix-hairpin-helix domain-containing protein n=1 Tax=Amycolatopsis sp. MEPSY49 TaxID=3151600 RepID=UPI003EFAC290
MTLTELRDLIELCGAGEVPGEERGRSPQGGVCLVEEGGDGLEDVVDAGSDVEGDRHVVGRGIPHDSPERIKAGLQYTLSQASDNGHCYLPEPNLITELSKLTVRLGGYRCRGAEVVRGCGIGHVPEDDRLRQVCRREEPAGQLLRRGNKFSELPRSMAARSLSSSG